MARPKKSDTPATNGSAPISAVVRVFSILETLSTHKSINLEHLAQQTKLAKPTVYRFLNTLRDLGYVRRDKNDQYFTTLRMFSIGSRALDHMDLYTLTRPIAEELSEKLGETVHVGIREGREGIYILKIESKYTIRMYSQVGKRLPLYCTAIGKCLLSDFALGDLETYVKEDKLVPFTPHTIRDLSGLSIELEQVRELGFAEDREEHEEGIRCMAAPIRDWTGKIIAAISTSWPLFRFDQARSAEYSTAIQSAAAEISAILGGVET